MPIFESDHFSRLLKQSRAGCRDSLGQLLQPFRLPLLVGRQELEMPGRIDLAELLQETFHEAVAQFGQFQGNTEGQLFVWLRQIMNHQNVSLGQRHPTAQKRDVRREVSLDETHSGGALRDLIPDDDLTPFSSTRAQEKREIIQRGFELLKPEQQRVIDLHHTAGKSFAEIAELLGKSTKAVAKIWERGLKAWRETLASLGVEDPSS